MLARKVQKFKIKTYQQGVLRCGLPFMKLSDRASLTNSQHGLRMAFTLIGRERRLKVDDSAANGNCNSLRAIACPQLLHDVLDMNFNRLFGDEQFSADVTVAVPFGDLSQ